MIRAEIKTSTFKKTKRLIVFCEDTLAEAKAYTEAMKANGVIVLEENYYDRDARIAAIQAGE